MAEEEQGEDPENEAVGVGRNRCAGRDVEVAAEQAGEDLSHSDVRRAEGPGGPVGVSRWRPSRRAKISPTPMSVEPRAPPVRWPGPKSRSETKPLSTTAATTT